MAPTRRRRSLPSAALAAGGHGRGATLPAAAALPAPADGNARNVGDDGIHGGKAEYDALPPDAPRSAA